MKLFRLIFALTILIVLLAVRSANAIDIPMSGGGTNTPTNLPSVANYNYVFGNLLAWNSSEVLSRSIIPVTGTAKDLRIELGTAPGTSSSYVFTFVKNGIDTSLTCTVQDLNTTCNDLVNGVLVVAGDTLSIKSVAGGPGPVIPGTIRFSWVLDTADDSHNAVIGSSRATFLSNSATTYGVVQGAAAPSVNIFERDQVIPTSGIFDAIYAELSGAPGTSAQYTFIMTKNGVDEPLNCIISDSDTFCSNAASSVTVSPGDIVALKIVPFGSPTTRIARWGFRWRPTIQGEALYLHSSGAPLNVAGSLRYNTVSGTTQTWISGETNAADIAAPFSARKLFISLGAAPASTASYAFNVRVGNAVTPLLATVSGANTTASNNVNLVSVSAGSKISISQQSSGTPVQTYARVSFVAFTGIDPTATPTATPTNTGTPANTPTPTVTPTPGGPTATPTPTFTPTIPGSETRYACVKVTNLNNTGAGSLRDCLSQSFPRVCVFTVSGRIPLTGGNIRVSNPNYVIAGQTAPGGGVMLTNSGLALRASNGWVEHLAINPGDAQPGQNLSSRDGIVVEQTTTPVRNINLSNLSIRHAVDGSFDTFGDVGDITIRDSLIGEPLYAAVPGEVPHSTAGLVNTNTSNLTWLRNFIVHSQNRNIQIVAGTSVEFINNYIFHFGRNQSNVTTLDNDPSRGLTTPHRLDYIGNLMVAGPTSVANAFNLVPYGGNALNAGSLIYVFDNRGPRRTSDAQSQTLVTNVPAQFLSPNRTMSRTTSGIIPVGNLVSTLAPTIGARPWARRPVDARIINAAVNQTGNYVDCLENCGFAIPDMNGGVPRLVPEGGYDPITPETRDISCAADYSWSELRSFLSSFESEAPVPTPTVTSTPTNTPTITPTPGPGTPTASPTPTRTATPGPGTPTVAPTATNAPAMTATMAARQTIFHGSIKSRGCTQGGCCNNGKPCQ